MSSSTQIGGQSELITTKVGPDAPSIGSDRDCGIGDFKRAVRVLSNHAVDRRTSVGKAPRGWHDELIADFGGDTAISTQQRALVDLVIRTKLIPDNIDAWLLKQPSLVNARKRSLLPVVRDEDPTGGRHSSILCCARAEAAGRKGQPRTNPKIRRAGRGAMSLPDIVEFVTNPQLLNLTLSEAQATPLRAIYGLPLSATQLDLFRACTGRRQQPLFGGSLRSP